MSIAATKRAEISAIVQDIRDHSKELARQGIDATEPGELNEARQILKRIEQRILANMPTSDHGEQREVVG
jgi:hypothetical protein